MMKFIFYFYLIFLVGCSSVATRDNEIFKANRSLTAAQNDIGPNQNSALPAKGDSSEADQDEAGDEHDKNESFDQNDEAESTVFSSSPTKSDQQNKTLEQEKVSGNSSPYVHYDEIFKRARELLKEESHKKNQRITSKIPESAVVEYLQNHPDKLNSDQAELLKIVKKESKSQKDQTKHLRLIPPAGMPGYSNLKFYVNHPYYRDGKTIKASNLIKVWNDFLSQAKTKIMLNVFDFDLEEIAATLIAKAHSGVSVTVGIDDGTIQTRPEVAYIYEYLKRNGVNVNPIDSVKLNHQKMAVIDWDLPQTAKVLFSSGNLTQSCLGPEGDLKKIPAFKRPKRSVPNANHVMTMSSWLLANLVVNELTKTIDQEFHYRGSQYPILGSYQITGPGVDPHTLEAYPEDSLIISFSPGGGYRNINKNIIGHFIRASDGPIRMIQFAYSSKEVTEALVEKAQLQGDKFDFKSVGDTPFAMQDWSQFLAISGLKKVKNSKGEKEFLEIENPFKDVLGKEGFSKLRKNVMVAPWYYSNGRVEVDGVEYKVNAKIHHKILAAGPFAIVGTSFNFSESAQKNNEQILVFRNKELVKDVDGMTQWLAKQSGRSVFDEAIRRNRFVTVPENVLPSAEPMTSKTNEADAVESDEDSTETKQASP